MALAEGDIPTAAKRLAAIWALHADHERLPQLTQAVLSGPEGRSAFAGELANGPNWRRNFASRAAAMLPGAVHSATIAEAERRGAEF